MKKVILAVTCIFLMLSGCNQENDCQGSNVTHTPNPNRGAFVGNYHYTVTYLGDTIPQHYDMSITIPSNSYGNFIVIPWSCSGSNAIFSTSDSTCSLNNSCIHMSSGSTTGFIRNDSLFIQDFSHSAPPPNYIDIWGVGVKY